MPPTCYFIKIGKIGCMVNSSMSFHFYCLTQHELRKKKREQPSRIGLQKLKEKKTIFRFHCKV